VGSAPVRQPSMRPLCLTPNSIGAVCVRGERELVNWSRAPNSSELLGTFAQLMVDSASYFYNVANIGGTQRCVRVLSINDGCADDSANDIQAKHVPTSVMLAHAFAISSGPWQNGRAQVRVVGGDVRNVNTPWWQPQRFPWQLPPWLEHRFVALDNTRDFVPQLFAGGAHGVSQCEDNHRFDAVFSRHGLCFCDDPSKISQTWPLEVAVTRQYQSTVCGIYRLELYLCEGRPAYRKGDCVLQWCPARGEWAVLDHTGGAWAYARADVGHPVLARGPWAVWDGTQHVNDPSFGCELAQAGSPPWHQPPTRRICCCGATGEPRNLLNLLQCVTAVLDTSHQHSFALLHGAWTNGTQAEVEQLHQQIEESARLFNELRIGNFVAAVLWRETVREYWLQCNGVIIFQPGSRADPYRS